MRMHTHTYVCAYMYIYTPSAGVLIQNQVFIAPSPPVPPRPPPPARPQFRGTAPPPAFGAGRVQGSSEIWGLAVR